MGISVDSPKFPSGSQNKSAGLAWLISLVVPGGGQIYYGKTARGLWTLLFSILALSVVLSARPETFWWGAALRTLLVLYAFAFLDAYFTAREIRAGAEPPEYQNPRVAATLNLLTRGFGYFYLGQRKKGLLVFSGLTLLGGIASLRRPGQTGLWVLAVGVELLLAGIAIHAYWIAKRELQPGRRRPAVTSPSFIVLGLAADEPLPPRPDLSPAPRVQAGPATRLSPMVPITLACCLAVGYVGLSALGVAMPNYRFIDQSRATVREALGGTVYQNSRYGVQLYIPAGWEFALSNQGSMVVAMRQEGGCSAELIPQATLPFRSLESQAATVESEILRRNPILSLEGRKLTRLGELPAFELVVAAQIDGNNVIQHYLLAQHGLTLYALIITVAADLAPVCQSDMDIIQERAALSE